jgi:PTS system glucose-specific IIC component
MQLDILAGKVITVTDGTNNVSVKLTFDIISKAVDMHGKLAFQGVNPGQYMQGKYSFMMFALPAAAIAMILIVPKGENRKQAFAIIGSSAATSFLTGITEPLEFTFLFLAP